MPTKKKTDPAMEEKIDENIEEMAEGKVEEKTEEKLRSEDILTVDARDVIETDEDRENSVWFELRNAFRSHRILSGRMDAVERTPTGMHLVIVYYKDFRVVIPYEEMNINLVDDPELGDLNVRKDKIIGTMLGSEIDFIIKGIDQEERTIVASRKEAMMTKRNIFYSQPKADGSYHVTEGRVVQARVIAVAEKVIRVEVFGVECPIIARDISWDWMGDCHDYYHIGDRILVRVTDIQNRDDIENLRIRADIRSITDAEMVEKLNKCTLQARYAGVITDIHGGRLYIRLTNGVNAIAETCYDSRTPGKRDEVSFVLTKINTERRIAYGIVARIIRQNFGS